MYIEDTYKEPFWAENKGFMTGRDPLGIQNSSIATYSRLLPGMTNVTLRLRYYGFYMWLLSEYHTLKKDDNEQTLNYHYNFIRRAELVIAYLMVNKFPNEQSIVGSDFAGKNIHTIEEQGYYDLAKGADKDKNTAKGTVYWDYISGALGQYFAGSLINLQLIGMTNRFFIIQERGRKLAQAFKDGIGNKSRATLLDVIATGKLTHSQMEGLTEFSINGITKGSAEWGFYKDMMLADDGITDSQGKIQSQRRQTIKHYLSYLETNEKKVEDFPFEKVQYLHNVKKVIQDASFGWYYYRINELFHYSLESIFWGLLVELDGKVVDIREFIEDVSQKVKKISIDSFLEKEDSTLSEILDYGFRGTVEDDQEKLEQLVKEGKNKEAIALAFQVILRVYLDNKSNLDAVYEYERRNYLTDKKGRVSEVVNGYVLQVLEFPYQKYIHSSLKNLINDHISTAYRKMGNGESNLLKFVIENNFITHVQTMTPRFTSPRLRTLNNFLSDLRFVEEERLSEWGEDLLLELGD
jgi:hypothetical protein